MGTKRVGLARVEALMEGLKRDLALGAGSSLSVGALTPSSLIMDSETVSTDAAACSTTVPLTILDHDGDEGVTLADGSSVGQVKIFISSTDNTVTLTPATTAGAYTTIATTNIGETFMLVWSGADGWAIVSRSSGAAANATSVAAVPTVA